MHVHNIASPGKIFSTDAGATRLQSNNVATTLAQSSLADVPNSPPNLLSGRSQVVQQSETKLRKNPYYATLIALIEKGAADTKAIPVKRVDGIFEAIQEHIDENLFTIEERCELLMLLLTESSHFQEKIVAQITQHPSVVMAVEKQYPFNLYKCIEQSMQIFEPQDFVDFIVSLKKSDQLTDKTKAEAVENLLQKLFERLTSSEETFTFKELFAFVPAFKGHIHQKSLQQKAAHMRLQQFKEQHVDDSSKFNLAAFKKLLNDLNLLLGTIDMSMEQSLVAAKEHQLLGEAVSRLPNIDKSMGCNAVAEAVKDKVKQVFEEGDPLAINFSEEYSSYEEESEDESLETQAEESQLEFFNLLRDDFEMISTGNFQKIYSNLELTAIKPDYDKIAQILGLAPLQIDNDIDNDIIDGLCEQLVEALEVNSSFDANSLGQDLDADEAFQIQMATVLQNSRTDMHRVDIDTLFEQLQLQILKEGKDTPTVNSYLESITYALNWNNKHAAKDLLKELLLQFN